jgi:O-antigen/teichoic acid export membrane protein
MRINKADVIWNYAATILRVASYALLLPFILRTMPSEMVGVWSVFMAINSFAALLDLGFSPSFTRNVTYIFSGIKTLRVTGFHEEDTDKTVDYGLLKGIIVAMKWFYLRMAVILFLLLATLGTYYLWTVLKNYKGPQTEIYIAWMVLCAICTYTIYTQYLDCLLQGRGHVKRSKQIVIVGQSVYIVIAAAFILAKFGLLAIISAQAISVIIIRVLVSKSFFTKEIKEALHNAIPRPRKEVLDAIYPNAIKIGLTWIGAFVIQKSSILIGSLHLPLEDIATYGITIQLISMIANFSTVYTSTYTPKIVQSRVTKDTDAIKEVYIKGQVVLILTYVAGGAAILFLGKWGLALIGSKTQLMSFVLIALALVIAFLESNHGIAAGVLLTNNEVPFFKASLVAAAVTITLLYVMLYRFNMGLWAMVLAPGIAQLYNNWRWPYELYRQLNISIQDVGKVIKHRIKMSGGSAVE